MAKRVWWREMEGAMRVRIDEMIGHIYITVKRVGIRVRQACPREDLSSRGEL